MSQLFWGVSLESNCKSDQIYYFYEVVQLKHKIFSLHKLIDKSQIFLIFGGIEL